MNRTDLVWCACVVRKGLTIHCGSWGLSCCLPSRAGGNRIRVPNFRTQTIGVWKSGHCGAPFPCARLSLVCKQLTRSDTFRLQGSLTGRWERLMIFALAILRIDFEVFDLIRPHGFLPLQRELYFPGFPSLFMLL